jgi:hypothetical protein
MSENLVGSTPYWGTPVPSKATGITGSAILIALGLVLLFATWTKLHGLYPEAQSRILFSGYLGLSRWWLVCDPVRDNYSGFDKAKTLRLHYVLRNTTMCRNIKTLANFEPPATDDEIRASSLQFVRKLSGTTKPSRLNEAAFNQAVDEVTAAAHRLVHSLHTNAPPRNREVEMQKAKERSLKRFA